MDCCGKKLRTVPTHHIFTLIRLDFFRNHVRWSVLKSTNPCFRHRALMPEVAEQYLFLKLNLFLYLFDILNDWHIIILKLLLWLWVTTTKIISADMSTKRIPYTRTKIGNPTSKVFFKRETERVWNYTSRRLYIRCYPSLRLRPPPQVVCSLLQGAKISCCQGQGMAEIKSLSAMNTRCRHVWVARGRFCHFQIFFRSKAAGSARWNGYPSENYQPSMVTHMYPQRLHMTQLLIRAVEVFSFFYVPC